MKAEVYKFLILLFLSLFISHHTLFAQQNVDFYSYKNRLAFGNYLFCQKDYLRAIGEYTWLQDKLWSDSIQFKIGVSYFRMNKFNEAYIRFNMINDSSSMFVESEIEKIRTLYYLNDYDKLHSKISVLNNSEPNHERELLELDYSVMLLHNGKLPEESIFLKPFKSEEKNEIKKLYEIKLNPKYKSQTTAAILSTLIPGLGKIYANEISDGITSFLLTGLFTYLAVNKFQNNHNGSGLLYSSIAAFFYAGNIYGSIAAVQNYNVGLKISFTNDVKIFINDRNQFLPTPKYLCD